MPPLAAGAVQTPVIWESPGVRVSPPGADGKPLQGDEAAVADVDTHAPRRALTVGLTALAGTVIDAEVPDTSVATVLPAPSVTS